MNNRRVMVVKSGGAEAFAEWRDCFAALDPLIELIAWDDALRRPDLPGRGAGLVMERRAPLVGRHSLPA